MALKTEKTETISPTAPVAPPVPRTDTVVLELSLYKLYTWGGYTYEQGKPYRFKTADAMTLLAEQDLGRPVWRQYRAPRAKAAPKNEPIDATRVSAPVPVDEFGTVVPSDGKKRIDIGDDSEIADLLPKEDDGSGDVTV